MEDNQQLQSYISRTGMSFKDYHEWFDEQASMAFNANWLQMIQKDYFDKNAVGNNNYMEVGAGPGYVLSHFQSYFNNLCFIEPNEIFIKTAKQKIIDKDPHKSFEAIHKFVEDFEPHKDLKNKFDFINIQNVFWHIHLNKWNDVLNNLFYCLNKDNIDDNNISLLSISHSHSQCTCVDIVKHYIPELRTIEYIIDHFQEICDQNKNIEMKIVKDPFQIELPESVAMTAMLDLFKIDFPIYNVSFEDLDIEEAKSVMKYYWKRDGMITDKIDETLGEFMVTFYPASTHLLITTKN